MRPALRYGLLSLLVAAPALADETIGSFANFGAVMSPVTLGPGESSAYGFVGVPELAAGYRQGIGRVEVEARARFQYFDLSLAAEGVLKLNVLKRDAFDLAPELGIGLVGNSGSHYFDSDNFAYFGLRLLPGVLVGYRLADTARLLGQLEVPIDIPLSPSGGYRFSTLAGGGAEIYVGNGMSAMALGEVGFESLKSPLGDPVTRFAFSVRLGLGWRIF